MNTKERILDEALTLFSEKGYANVYVNDIAERVGIKAPSLYKHYKNKQAIFDAILDVMYTRFKETAGSLNIAGDDAGAAGQAVLLQIRPGERSRTLVQLKPGHIQLRFSREQQEGDGTGGAAEINAPPRGAGRDEGGKQHAVGAQALVLGLGEDRPARPEFMKVRHH